MKVLKLSVISDLLFNFLIFFLLSFVWVRYFVHNNTLIFISCILSSLTITLVVTKLKIKKQNKLKINKEDILKAQSFSLEMLYLTSKEQCLKICNLLNIDSKNIKKDFILTNKTIIKPMFEKFECNQVDIIKNIAILKNENVEKIIFCAPNFCEDTLNFKNCYNDIQIKLIDEKLFYSVVLKPLNYKSALKPSPKVSKKEKFKILLSIAFNSKKTKSYLCYAILLFCFSFFYRYNVYYIISCSIFLLFALFSKFNKIFNKNEEKSFY